MGFETDSMLYHEVTGDWFEVSLWDLKLDMRTRTTSSGFHLKYPYGIWNYRAAFDAFVRYSDLKYPYGIWNGRKARRRGNPVDLKYPYGIWNLAG